MTLSISSSRALLLSTVAALAVTGCTKPKQTTAAGSIAGGALGASLGAIVGNQTGNAGSGVAIGAVAGAATGALIGNALQAQNEKSDAQKETLQRQEKAIRAQRSEIEELRRMQSDTGYSSARTQNVNAYLVEQKRLQLQKRGPDPRGQTSEARYSPPPLSVRSSEPLARYEAKSAPSPVKPKRIKTSAPGSKGIEEKDLASKASTTAHTVKREAKAETGTMNEQSTAKVAQNTSKSGCEEGKEAREAAASASDNSDKLFHLRKALRLCPNNAETHYDLGKAYLSMDRAADANYEFKQALSIDPSYQAARESLKDLDQGNTHY